METDSTLHADDPARRQPRSFDHHLATVARILMGLIFFVFGLNGLLHFIAQPKAPMPEGAMAFAGALMKTAPC